MQKTNAMRSIEKAGVKFEYFEYDSTITNGELVAQSLNEDPNVVFKTLVTVANNGEHIVFIIPVAQTLNLKKCAKVAGVKSVEMIKQKELLPLTGYIHGGCSPVGMKKFFRTFIDESAILYDDIFVSGGRVGLQIKINPEDLKKVIDVTFSDLT